MKKTYVTSMPSRIGAFLKASECFSLLGINITRVSYNKAVDSHTLFIDAEGTPEQLAKAEEELAYIYTVLDSLTRAETEREMMEIRDELYHSGYTSKMKNYTEKKNKAPSIQRYETSEGYTVYCGRNNLANDHLTTKLADRNDWWFHVKNQPGSHVVLCCKDGEDEPTETAFTEAAMIAAYNSKASDGVMVPVDYLKVRQVKKPAGAKPGFVVYYTNWTAYVTPEEDKVKAMMRKG